MAFAEHTARVTWNGDLLHGSGTVSTESPELRDAVVSWPRRADDTPGLNPEQLLAASLASCFSMAFAAGLAQEGHVPERLEVAVTCGVRKDAAGLTVESMQIDVTGTVEDVDQARFEQIATTAKSGCPISRALADDVRVDLTANVRSGATA